MMLDLRRAMRGENGLSLALMMPLLLVMMAFAAAAVRLTDSGMRFSSLHRARQKAFYVADGGLQAALARLHADRMVAAGSVSYAAAATGEFDGDPYTYTIVQDPMFPTDPTRKQATVTGTSSGSSGTLVSQLQVFKDNPLCDWALLADSGTAELVNGFSIATNLLNGNVHSNNSLAVKSTTATGLRGLGRFESVGAVRSESAGATSSLMGAQLFRGGAFLNAGSHLHNPLTGAPVLGIHFSNGAQNHGVQQAVAPIAFPIADWKGLEQSPAATIVDQNSVPFGSWDASTGTWVISGARVFPGDTALEYFVRGNVRFATITLARSADVSLTAEGTIEVDQLSLLQTSIGGVLGIGVNSTQALRLIGRGDVFIGRGIPQSADGALVDLTRPGVDLSSSVAVVNRIRAHSQAGTVWVKSSAISAFTATELNLLGARDAAFAVTGAIASTPTGPHCDPVI